MAVRRAFPTVVRRKIGAVYCYCGLQVTPHSNRALSTGSCTSTNNVTSQVRNNTSTNCIPNKDAASRIKIKKEIKRSSTGSYEQHREHYITSININLSELHRTDNDPILGEGTFAKCILGTYKIIEVAINFLRDSHSGKLCTTKQISWWKSLAILAFQCLWVCSLYIIHTFLSLNSTILTIPLTETHHHCQGSNRPDLPQMCHVSSILRCSDFLIRRPRSLSLPRSWYLLYYLRKNYLKRSVVRSAAVYLRWHRTPPRQLSQKQYFLEAIW